MQGTLGSWATDVCKTNLSTRLSLVLNLIDKNWQPVDTQRGVESRLMDSFPTNWAKQLTRGRVVVYDGSAVRGAQEGFQVTAAAAAELEKFGKREMRQVWTERSSRCKHFLAKSRRRQGFGPS
jgi:hypothetical protein